MQIQKEYKTHEEWDKALIFLFVAMAIESVHHVCYLLHIQSYAGDGYGIPALTTIGDIMEVFLCKHSQDLFCIHCDDNPRDVGMWVVNRIRKSFEIRCADPSGFDRGHGPDDDCGVGQID